MNSPQIQTSIHRSRKYEYLRFAALLLSYCLLISMSFDSKRPILDSIRLLGLSLMIVVLIFTFLETFVRHTLLTDQGIEYRGWTGKTQFFPYSQLSWLKWKDNSIVFTDGKQEIEIWKRDLKFPDAVTFLKSKVTRMSSPV